MTLLDQREGTVVEIRALLGGEAMATRLHAFGFYTGSKIRLIRVAPFRGPILVEDVATGARVMIGRGMAGKIEVSNGDPSRR